MKCLPQGPPSRIDGHNWVLVYDLLTQLRAPYRLTAGVLIYSVRPSILVHLLNVHLFSGDIWGSYELPTVESSLEKRWTQLRALPPHRGHPHVLSAEILNPHSLR